MQTIRKFVIVGGGSAGWMTALLLAHHLRQDQCEIEVIEAKQIGILGVGESTVPPLMDLLRRLGIDEHQFVTETQATYKLGILFKNWHTKESEYFHPFGSFGKPIGSHEFYQCWLKAHQAGNASQLTDFSPSFAMAKLGRFYPPQQAQNTPIGGANYALHIDANLVANYLRRSAEKLGVKRTEGTISNVVLHENGKIARLITEQEQQIGGDFFIDCSGFRAALIEQFMGVNFVDWSEYLPCNRALVMRSEQDAKINPFTIATAQKSGWSWKIPLQHRVGQGYVYANQFCSDDEAYSTLRKQTKGSLVEEPRLIQFRSGHRQVFWQKNCLSIGLSAGFVEPLESTAIHLIARGLEFFLRYFPDRECDPALIREYNRRMKADYEEVRDFIVLHYCTTQRSDTPFWQWCQNMPIPESLKERIELFQGHGSLREGTDELFRNASWQSVFEGMGIHPKKYCPRVDRLNQEEINQQLSLAKKAIDGMVTNLPTHSDYLHAIRTKTE
jgi:tryptophan 7-halogenase